MEDTKKNSNQKIDPLNQAQEAANKIGEGAVQAARAVKQAGANAVTTAKNTLSSAWASNSNDDEAPLPKHDEVDLTPEEQMVRHPPRIDFSSPPHHEHAGPLATLKDKAVHAAEAVKERFKYEQHAGERAPPEYSDKFPETLEQAVRQSMSDDKEEAIPVSKPEAFNTGEPVIPGPVDEKKAASVDSTNEGMKMNKTNAAIHARSKL